MEWLKSALGLSKAALARVEAGNFRVPPSLSNAQAQHVALRDELRMSDSPGVLTGSPSMITTADTAMLSG